METLELMPVRVRITAILKKAIYSGEYKSGEELSLTKVASQLGVSRTPVREAFQALAAEGLITLRMNKGAIVNQIDQKFIKDTFEMRILLESEAAARAAANGMDTSTLLKRLHAMERQTGQLNKKDYELLNQDIHMAIWNAADNGRSVSDEESHFRQSTAEHICILRHIQAGQAEEAKKAMAGHISRSMNNILKAYEAV